MAEKPKNRKLNKPFRTPKGPKKFAVYVKDPKTGNIKIVRFGDPNMEIKRDDPKRRKAFRDRHNCDERNDKTKPSYWSCKFWSEKPVNELLASSREGWNDKTFFINLTEWDGRTFWPQEEIAPYFEGIEVEESIADESHDYHLEFTPDMMAELHEKGRIEVTIREGGRDMVVMFTYKGDKGEAYHHYEEEEQGDCGGDYEKRSEAAKISAQVEKALKKKVKEHNEKHGDKKGKRVTLRMLKAVFRRGVGAYNTNPQSVRPNVKSSDQWAMARVNVFLKAVRTNRFNSGKFDTDLLPKDHPLSSKK
jgi:metal-responsive CopG/Arc/MetJ family transcriptional regulator